MPRCTSYIGVRIILSPKSGSADKQREYPILAPSQGSLQGSGPVDYPMANTSPTDYKKLFLQAEERAKQTEELVRRTTFTELLHFCHSLLSEPLRAQTPSRSTTGSIPPPTGKYCPTRLALWTDCSARQQKIYSSVCKYLKPTAENPAQLFAPLTAHEEDAKRLVDLPISSEQGLEIFEKFAVEGHVRDIIKELYKIDVIRDSETCSALVYTVAAGAAPSVVALAFGSVLCFL